MATETSYKEIPKEIKKRKRCKCGNEIKTKTNLCNTCSKDYMHGWRKNKLDEGIPRHDVYNYIWRRRNPERYILHTVKSRAKKKGLDFNLSKEDIFIPEYCPILNIKLDIQVGGNNDKNSPPSLDRIDPSRGYVKGNVRVISWRANNLLSDGTLEEFKLIVENFNNGT